MSVSTLSTEVSVEWNVLYRTQIDDQEEGGQEGQVFHKLLRDKTLKQLGEYTQIWNKTVRLYIHRIHASLLHNGRYISWSYISWYYAVLQRPGEKMAK